MKKSVLADSVDDYLALVPKPERIALEKLRKIIKAAAPGTTEAISYKIPIFKLHDHPWWASAHQGIAVRSMS